MAKARKLRKPGAGRPPAGPITGKKAIFSTRITEATRSALDAEARASGQSVSQLVEQMIELGLTTKAEGEHRSPVRALSWLVGYLANACAVGSHKTTEVSEWHNDTFVFDALTKALSLLFEQLRPSASALAKDLADQTRTDIHPITRELMASSETWAKYNFWRLWDELAGTAHLPPVGPPGLGLWSVTTDEQLPNYIYSLHKVRRDLNLDEGRLKPMRRDGLAEDVFGNKWEKKS